MWAVPSSLACATGWLNALLVVVFMLDTAVGGNGAANVFSWHPMLMSVAFLGLSLIHISEPTRPY